MSQKAYMVEGNCSSHYGQESRERGQGPIIPFKRNVPTDLRPPTRAKFSKFPHLLKLSCWKQTLAKRASGNIMIQTIE